MPDNTEDTLKVIIPCAGAGTRMKHKSKDTPKILHEHAGMPIIDHIIDSILSIEPYPHFIFVLNEETGEQIIEHLRQHVLTFLVDYCIQPEPLGLDTVVH